MFPNLNIEGPSYCPIILQEVFPLLPFRFMDQCPFINGKELISTTTFLMCLYAVYLLHQFFIVVNEWLTLGRSNRGDVRWLTVDVGSVFHVYDLVDFDNRLQFHGPAFFLINSIILKSTYRFSHSFLDG